MKRLMRKPGLLLAAVFFSVVTVLSVARRVRADGAVYISIRFDVDKIKPILYPITYQAFLLHSDGTETYIPFAGNSNYWWMSNGLLSEIGPVGDPVKAGDKLVVRAKVEQVLSFWPTLMTQTRETRRVFNAYQDGHGFWHCPQAVTVDWSE